MPGCTARVPPRALQYTRQGQCMWQCQCQGRRMRGRAATLQCTQQPRIRITGREGRAGRHNTQIPLKHSHTHKPVSEATARWMSSASSPLCSPPAMAAITALCRERSSSCGAEGGQAGRQHRMGVSQAWHMKRPSVLGSTVVQPGAAHNED